MCVIRIERVGCSRLGKLMRGVAGSRGTACARERFPGHNDSPATRSPSHLRNVVSLHRQGAGLPQRCDVDVDK